MCQHKKTQLPFGKFSSAVEFWRIKHAERPPKPPRLGGPLFALSPSKILGQNCIHRKKADFDAGARKGTEGTLCGCRGGLTPQPRKSGLFTALFSYAGTPNAPVLFIHGSLLRTPAGEMFLAQIVGDPG